MFALNQGGISSDIEMNHTKHKTVLCFDPTGKEKKNNYTPTDEKTFKFKMPETIYNVSVTAEDWKTHLNNMLAKDAFQEIWLVAMAAVLHRHCISLSTPEFNLKEYVYKIMQQHWRSNKFMPLNKKKAYSIFNNTRSRDGQRRRMGEKWNVVIETKPNLVKKWTNDMKSKAGNRFKQIANKTKKTIAECVAATFATTPQ